MAQHQQHQNWFLKLEAVLPTMHLALKITLFLLKITTIASFGILVYSGLLGKIPHWAVISLAILTAYLGSFAIDGLMDKLLPFAGSRIDGSLESRHKIFHWFTRIVTLLLLVASGTITWWLMPQAADMATKKPNDQKYLAAIDSINRRASLSLESMAQEIRQAQASEKARIRQAQKDGQKLVRDAVKAGGSNFARLWWAGNDWVKTDRKFNKIRAGIKAAQDKADALVAEQKALVPTLLAQRDQLQGTTLTAATQLTTTLGNQVQKQWDAYNKKVATITTVAWLIDLFWMILVILLAIAIWLVDGFEVEEEKTAVGVAFNILTLAQRKSLEGIENRAINLLSGITPTARQAAPSPPTGGASGPTVPPTAPPTGAPAPNLALVRNDNEDAMRAMAAQVAALEALIKNQADRQPDRQAELLSDKGFGLSVGPDPAPVGDPAPPVGGTVGETVGLSVPPVGDLSTPVVTVGEGGKVQISFNGESWGDTSKFAEAARKWYERQFTSSTEAGKKNNKDKWEAARPILEKFYTLEFNGNRVKMVPLAGEFKPHVV